MFRTKIDGSEILDMNEKYLEIFGRTREEMVNLPSIIHWADPGENPNQGSHKNSQETKHKICGLQGNAESSDEIGQEVHKKSPCFLEPQEPFGQGCFQKNVKYQIGDA